MSKKIIYQELYDRFTSIRKCISEINRSEYISTMIAPNGSLTASPPSYLMTEYNKAEIICGKFFRTFYNMNKRTRAINYRRVLISLDILENEVLICKLSL